MFSEFETTALLSALNIKKRKGGRDEERKRGREVRKKGEGRRKGEFKKRKERKEKTLVTKFYGISGS